MSGEESEMCARPYGGAGEGLEENRIAVSGVTACSTSFSSTTSSSSSTLFSFADTKTLVDAFCRVRWERKTRGVTGVDGSAARLRVLPLLIGVGEPERDGADDFEAFRGVDFLAF